MDAVNKPRSIIRISSGRAGMPLWCRRTHDRLRWYQVVYRLLYRLGLNVWQRGTPPADLITMVDGPSPLPPGRALDLGCGTGTDTIYLATHGWDVTAVDATPKALSIAQRNATAAGVTAHFIHGDVTRLGELGVGSGFTLLLDFGCFHTLPEDRRTAYVHGVTDAAAPGATLLLYGFRRPPKAAPLHAGVTVDEIRSRFISSGWELVKAQRSSIETPAARGADERFELWCYLLRRADAA